MRSRPMPSFTSPFTVLKKDTEEYFIGGHYLGCF